MVSRWSIICARMVSAAAVRFNGAGGCVFGAMGRSIMVGRRCVALRAAHELLLCGVSLWRPPVHLG